MATPTVVNISAVRQGEQVTRTRIIRGEDGFDRELIFVANLATRPAWNDHETSVAAGGPSKLAGMLKRTKQRVFSTLGIITDGNYFRFIKA